MAEQVPGAVVAPWLRLLGWLATLLACGYLAHALWQLDVARLASALSPVAWCGAGAAALVYAASLALLAMAWYAIADPKRGAGPRLALAIYGPAVIAKYLPGSVFQYASRQLRGGRAGLAQTNMARASIFEAACHVPMAAVVAATLASPAGAMGAVASAIAGGIAMQFGSKAAVRAAGGQLAFFSILGLLVTGAAMLVAGNVDPALLASWFMIAWIAGFLVPVAPGGIGVREAVFVALAGSSPPIAALAILMRLVTTVGDGITGLAGYWAATTLRSNRQASG